MRIRMRELVISSEALRRSALVEKELGVDFYTWEQFFKKAEIRDVLCFVTVAYCHLAKQSYVGSTLSENWLREVQRIFTEENLHYRVDRKGGVHFHPDQEFARATASAILQQSRYANSLDAFNKSMAAFAESLPNGKDAIRAVFTAIEGLFCLMFPDTPRLDVLGK
jgi:hypothetical protein